MDREEIEKAIDSLDTELLISGMEPDKKYLRNIDRINAQHHDLLCELVGERLDKPIGKYLDGYLDLSI